MRLDACGQIASAWWPCTKIVRIDIDSSRRAMVGDVGQIRAHCSYGVRLAGVRPRTNFSQMKRRPAVMCIDMAHKRAHLLGRWVDAKMKVCEIDLEVVHLLLSGLRRHAFREAKSEKQIAQKFSVVLERPLSRTQGPAFDKAVSRHALGGRQTSL